MAGLLHSDGRLIIFTDGGARGNPGHAGIGAVFYYEDEEGNRTELERTKKYIGETTNNFAEYTALIEALEHASKLKYKKVQCYLDSELVVKQLNGLYKIREKTLQPLAARVLSLTNRFSQVNFSHIHREKNAVADKMVNEAIDHYLKNV